MIGRPWGSGLGHRTLSGSTEVGVTSSGKSQMRGDLVVRDLARLS
jgi:hypothetical protein